MPPNSTDTTLAGLCLRYLLLLRSIAIAGAVAALATMSIALDARPPVAPIALVVAALSAYTAHSWRRMRLGEPVSEPYFFQQLMVDVAALTAILYFAGGSTNPLVSLFLLPVIVGAATLRAKHIWWLALTAAVCYTMLMFFHVPFPFHFAEGHQFETHVWGMWLGFILGAGLVSYFVSRIGSTLRLRDQALAQAREEALRAEQLVALGTLAAGTAHELGTPLGTMAILVRELEHQHTDDSRLTEDLQLLRSQIDRCKAILARMATQSGQAKADSGRRVAVDRYLEDLIAEWRTLRPGLKVEVYLEGPRPGPAIIADQTLSQAIQNILNNAADASSEHVEVHGHWDAVRLELDIRDEGPGLPEDVRDEIGNAFVSTKAAGTGLGVFLARTALARLGGSVTLSDRPGAGARAEIILPLTQLMAPEAVSR